MTVPQAGSAPTPAHDPGAVPLVVRIVAWSRPAAEAVAERIAALRPRLPQALLIEGVACSAPDAPDPALAPFSDELCAVVVTVEDQALRAPQYQAWVRRCIQEVGVRDDFRLFACMVDVSAGEFITRAESGQPVLADLLDTVQVTEWLEADAIGGALLAYLLHIGDIRDAAEFRAGRLAISIAAGRLAGIVQVASGVAVTVIGAGVLVAGRAWAARTLPGLWPSYLAAAEGIALVPLTTFALGMFSRPRADVARSMEDPSVRAWMAAAMLGGWIVVGGGQVLGGPHAWVLLGIAAGIALDVARRAGLQARRSRLPLDLKRDAAGRTNPAIEAAARGRGAHPLRCPLLPRLAPGIVISYARSSTWGRDLAVRLHDALRRQGARPFLDAHDIGEGSSWRRQLHREIAEANVFISIADRVSVTRAWVAAEMETALAGRALTGLPEIVVLIDSAVIADARRDTQPIFELLLEQARGVPTSGGPRFIVVSPETIDTLAPALAPTRFRTTSVFPNALRMVIDWVTLPLASLGPFGLWFGAAAAAVWGLEKWNGPRIGEYLSAAGWLAPVALLCAFWLAFTIRLAIASRFEVRHDTPTMLAVVHYLSAMAFLALLVLWIPRLPPLVNAWGLLAAAFGWDRANTFLRYVGNSKADFHRAAG